MKKVCTLLLITFMITSKLFSQASVVYDPTNFVQALKTTAEVYNLGQTMEKLKQVQEKIEDIKEEVEWLKSTVAVIQLIQLIEETTCIVADLDINMDIALDLGLGQSCIDNFQYRISINKLLLAIDQINSVLTKGVKMDAAQRWQIVSIVLDNFTESQLNFSAINKNLKKKIYVKNREKQVKKDSENFINSLASYYE